MAPAEITVDYYEYLGVTEYADDTQIKTSYKRLALLYHPDKNPGDTKAKAKFQVLVDAYTILSDSTKRRVYDLSLPRIRAQKTTQQSTSAKEEKKPRNNSSSTQKEDAAIRAFQEQLTDINKKLQALYQTLNWARNALKKGQKELDEITAALRRLDNEEKQDAAEEAAQNGWFTYLFRKPETEEQKDARARRRTERLVGRNVHTSKQTKQTKEVDRLLAHVRKVESDVAGEEARRASVEWQKQQRQNELNAAKWAREEKERQKEREAAQRRRQEEARKAQEETRKAQEEAWRAWEEKARKAQEESDRKAREDARKAQEQADKFWEQYKKNNAGYDDYYDRRSSEDDYGQSYQQTKTPRAKATSYTSPSGRFSHACRHRMWWSKVDGKHTCNECDMTLYRFAYQCPGCNKIACGGCMSKLKRGR